MDVAVRTLRPLLTAARWAGVAVAGLLVSWFVSVRVVGFFVFVVVWLVAIVLTSYGVLAIWLRRGPLRAIAVFLASVLIVAAGICTAGGNVAFLQGYFWADHDGFAAVSALADRGELASQDYYGELLPWNLRHLAVHGRAAWIGTAEDNGNKMLFLPQWTRLVDGGVGYAYSPQPPGDTYYDCFGDRCQAYKSFGGGWYWMA